MYISVALTAII